MRSILVGVLATFVLAGIGWADDMDDTYQKVDKYLYGVDGGATRPAKRQNTTPPDTRRSLAPASEDRPSDPPAAAVSSGAGDAVTWDFETGDLKGWTATGTAFNNQPTFGDNPTARHRGQPSQHQGDYWIGTYENRPTSRHMAGKTQGDGPQGTLTSQPFVINSNTITFLIGGGCDLNTVRVELLIDGRVVDKATGKCTETLAAENFPVGKYRGRSAQIRLVDNASGGWGHLNFDDMRFE